MCQCSYLIVNITKLPLGLECFVLVVVNYPYYNHNKHNLAGGGQGGRITANTDRPTLL